MAGLSSMIARRPWNDDIQLPDEVQNVPTLLTPEERQMLVWLARNCTDGAICELGSFLGGSTVSLAYGVTSSDRPERKVHTFDQLRCPIPTLKRFLPEPVIKLCDTNGDFELVFNKHISPFQNIIHVQKGDLLEKTWTGEKIALLFVDIMKTWNLSDCVISQFYPYLSPGSIIIHQDYYYDRSPWIIHTMELLADKVKLVGATEKYSAIFKVEKKITKGDIEKCNSRYFTPLLIQASAEQAAKRATGEHKFMLNSAAQNVADFPDATYEGQYPRMRVYEPEQASF